ncbi:hypothetical protein CR513_36585, partial [Mucuna pruriens]
MKSPLPSHLKYAYLDTEQQLPIIIANSLRQEEEDLTHEPKTKKTKSDHPRRCQERSNKTTCCRDHLPHLG